MRRKATLYPVAGSFQGKNRDCWRRRKRRAGERDGEDSLLERVTTEERQLSHNWPTVLFRRQIDPDLVSRANTMQQVAGTTTDFQHACILRDEQVVAMGKQLPVSCGEYRRPGLGLIKFRRQFEVCGAAGRDFLDLHGFLEMQARSRAAKSEGANPRILSANFQAGKRSGDKAEGRGTRRIPNRQKR